MRNDLVRRRSYFCVAELRLRSRSCENRVDNAMASNLLANPEANYGMSLIKIEDSFHEAKQQRMSNISFYILLSIF